MFIKKVLAIHLSVAMALTLFLINNEVEINAKDGSLGGGSGTAGDPYVIEDVWDLQNMSKDLSAHYVLGNDINASGTINWNSGAGFLPVGTNEKPFTGYLNGRNFTITGLFINRTTIEYVGLFGYVEKGGLIQNFGLIDNEIIGNKYVGGLIGSNNGLVNNCYDIGSITGNYSVGGLLGENYHGTVSNCFAGRNVSGNILVGGLLGYNMQGTVFNCYAIGNIIGGSSVGGLVGGNSGTVSNSYTIVNVSGSGSGVGGLVGGNSDTLSNSHYNVDAMLINGDHHLTIGGLFDDQYRDWFENNLSLDINDYPSLSPSSDYYGINNTQGLQDLLGFADVPGYKFRLTADIDLSNSPGLYIPYFAAEEFDGSNHTIINLYINQPFSYRVGMFGNNFGKIKNTGLEYINTNGYVSVGGLVGFNLGSVSNCYATGIISGKEHDVGGLVGYNVQGMLFNCFANGNVSGSSSVGGLVGYNVQGMLFNCFANGNVSGAGNQVGGLVGFNGNGKISNSYFIGNVSGEGNQVGGLVGYGLLGKISNSYYKGNVSGSSSVGGLVGETFIGTLENSYAQGSVARVVNSTSTDIGGFVGRIIQAKIINCYSVCSVEYIGDDDPTDKGFAGYVKTGTGYQMTGNFWDKQITGQTTTEGDAIGKNTVDMMKMVTYSQANWIIAHIRDHESETWYIDEGYDYPRLHWEAYTDTISPIAYAGVDQIIDEGDTVKFNGRGSSDNIAIVNYTWTFTDRFDIEIHEISPTYRFDNPGVYNVTLTVKDAMGNWNMDSMQVTVNDITPPIADAGSDLTVDEGTIVTFNGSDSYDNGGIINYTWSFIDGDPITLFSPEPGYQFNTPGVYDVALTVMDAAGHWDTDLMTVTVLDITLPFADAGPDQIVDVGSLVTFNGSGSHDNVGIVKWVWTFIDGDQITLLGSGPGHIFADLGTYVVTLNVTDAAGNWFTDTMTVTVLDLTSPVADAGPDQMIDEGNIVLFDGSGSYDNVGIVNYTWTFIYGDRIVLYGVDTSYRFDDLGVFLVTLNVSDAAGHWNIDTMTVTVRDITQPVAYAGPDRTVEEGSLVTFDGSGSHDIVGIVNYTWSFYDGSSSVVLYGISPSHTFSIPGIYTVTLTVKDEAGNEGSDTMKVEVKEKEGNGIEEDPFDPLLIIIGSIIVLAAILSLFMFLIFRNRKAIPEE